MPLHHSLDRDVVKALNPSALWETDVCAEKHRHVDDINSLFLKTNVQRQEEVESRVNSTVLMKENLTFVQFLPVWLRSLYSFPISAHAPSASSN